MRCTATSCPYGKLDDSNFLFYACSNPTVLIRGVLWTLYISHLFGFFYWTEWSDTNLNAKRIFIAKNCVVNIVKIRTATITVNPKLDQSKWSILEIYTWKFFLSLLSVDKISLPFHTSLPHVRYFSQTFSIKSRLFMKINEMFAQNGLEILICFTIAFFLCIFTHYISIDCAQCLLKMYAK